MPKTKHKAKKYASTSHPSIAAALDGHYRFPTHEEALGQLAILKQHFAHSKNSKVDHLVLWVKGYMLTEAEKEKGFTGNFVQLSTSRRSLFYTIVATKIERDSQYHPQRARPKQKHPDWGHPVLRGVLKKRVYPSFDEAKKELELLHQEYPTVSIPGEDKLYIIVYGKRTHTNKPVQKYKLTIRPCPEGFVIESKLNAGKTFAKIPAGGQAGNPSKGFSHGLSARAAQKNNATPVRGVRYFGRIVA